MTTPKEIRAIKRAIARESFETHTLHDPLVEGVLGRGEATWKGGMVTVTYGGKTFDNLTNAFLDDAKLYINGMAMGIACKYDKEIKALREEINAAS